MISVIVPVYNVEQYLSDCIRSILCQTYKDFELILVDDGSPDRSGEICDRYAEQDARIRVIHQPNGGVSRARNNGIRRARGEIVMFLDSDDFWLDSDVCEWVSIAFRAETLEVLEFGCVKFKELSEPKHVVGNEFHVEYVRVDERTKDLVFSDLIRRGYLTACAWNKAIRREFLIEHALFFREGVVAEDIDWNARLMLHAQSVGVSCRPCVAYRKRIGSITSSVSLKKIEQLLSNLEYVRDEVPLQSTYMSQYLAIHVANAYIASTKLSLNNCKEICERLRNFSLFLREDRGIRARVVRFLDGQDKLADWLEENIEECLTIIDCPPNVQRRLRTSNIMECINRQLKRRTNVVSIFPYEASLLRLVTAKAMDLSDEWEGSSKTYITPEKLRQTAEVLTAAAPQSSESNAA